LLRLRNSLINYINSSYLGFSLLQIKINLAIFIFMILVIFILPPLKPLRNQIWAFFHYPSTGPIPLAAHLSKFPNFNQKKKPLRTATIHYKFNSNSTRPSPLYFTEAATIPQRTIPDGPCIHFLLLHVKIPTNPARNLCK